MRLKKTSKTIIDKEDPFLNCKLEREPIADNLTKIIEGIDGGFVLSIDSPWGTGKSTFIEMWVQKLTNEKQNDEKQNNIFPIYFNAWENDFQDNPLIALIGELAKNLKGSYADLNINDLKKTSEKLFESGLFNIINHLIKKLSLGLVKIEEISETINGTLIRNHFENYEKKIELKNEIKETFKKIKEELKVEKVVFFVDELDRCRPDYAIQTLEKIKHFFNVDDYVFVLALDKKQLSHSVATIYGEGMDSEGYLRRFIDLDYSLPESSKEKYLDYLIETHKLNEREKNIEYFMNVIRNFAKEKDVSLRDLEKLFYKIKLVLPLLKKSDNEDNNYFETQFFAYFICMNVKYNNIYVDLINYRSKLLREFSGYQTGSRTGNVKKLEILERSFNWVNFDLIRIKSIKTTGNMSTDYFGMLRLLNEKISDPEYTIIGYIEYEGRNNLVPNRTFKYHINEMFRENEFVFKKNIEFINEFKTV